MTSWCAQWATFDIYVLPKYSTYSLPLNQTTTSTWLIHCTVHCYYTVNYSVTFWPVTFFPDTVCPLLLYPVTFCPTFMKHTSVESTHYNTYSGSVAIESGKWNISDSSCVENTVHVYVAVILAESRARDTAGSSIALDVYEMISDLVTPPHTHTRLLGCMVSRTTVPHAIVRGIS